MEKNYLRYQLSGGYINHWLAMGPCDTPIDDRPTEGESAAAFKTRMLHQHGSATPEFGKPPIEIDKYSWRGGDFFWEVDHTQEDHVIDRSGFVSALVYRRAWAFACLSAPAPVDGTFHVTLICPATVWLNGKNVLHVEHPMDAGGHIPQTYSVTARLKRGRNDLMVRMEQVAQGHIPMSLAVRVDNVSLDSTRILLPTVTVEGSRRQEWERAFEYAYLNRAVYYREDQINLICRDDTPSFRQVVMRLQKLDGSIYAESYGDLKAKQVIESLIAMQVPTSEMRAVLMPPPGFYYDRGFRARRDIPFWTSNYHYYEAPEHAQDERLIELMQEAVRCYDPLYAELAKMGFGWWELLEVPPVQKVIGQVKRHEAGTLADLLGLAIMHLRMGHYEKFPPALLPEIEECLLSYDYSEAAAPVGDLDLECNQILLHAAHVLATQIDANATFAASGLTGKQERTRAEKAAAAWLKEHGQTGFAQWNSHLDLIVAALSQLADLAESETVSDLAAVLLDKTLFGIAINSFNGTFGASRGDATPSTLRSGRFAPEAAISRLGWGSGGYTPAFKGVVCLGLAGKNYELPDMIRSIAVDRPLWMITRERQAPAGSDEVNTVAYKTPDFMLASAQDYRPGQRGKNEHIWQATLGPEALVYTNHPSSLIESDSRQAGRWCGNGSLPRVAQWKDALICLYNLPDDDWLGFTHAYFPEYAFDEHVREQGWAFARKGDGYLALHASPDMTFLEKGPDAYRELRVPGQQTVWLCQMGRAEVDGTFEDFRKAVLSKSMNVHDLHVEWETVRGDKLAFSWSGPLLVNGEQQPITGFRHMESLYGVAEMPAENMDIIFREQVMRLHFG
jgi:hypothetical protein